MSRHNIKDISASVRAKLLNNAKHTNRPFQEVLQYFAMERFLFRLSISPHTHKLVLKGGLMFTAWRVSATRPTMDIDLLGKMPNDVDLVVSVIKSICKQDAEPDGLVFDEKSIEGKTIKKDADYEGVRVSFLCYLQNARVNMQVDVGFGDVIVPDSVQLDYPTILGHASPKLNAYSRETTIAEKFEAMAKLGLINSRIRDFFDIWLLLRQFDFQGSLLAQAIGETFANRGTPIRPNPIALTDEFAMNPDKMRQWTGFLRKSRIDFAPSTLQPVVQEIAAFLMPVALQVARGEDFPLRWTAPGPWA